MRESLHFHEGAIGRKMDLKGDADEGPERKQEHWRDCLHHLTEQSKNVGGNADPKSHSGEVSDGKQEHVIGTGEKATLVTKQQRTRLNCVLVFCGR